MLASLSLFTVYSLFSVVINGKFTHKCKALFQHIFHLFLRKSLIFYSFVWIFFSLVRHTHTKTIQFLTKRLRWNKTKIKIENIRNQKIEYFLFFISYFLLNKTEKWKLTFFTSLYLTYFSFVWFFFEERKIHYEQICDSLFVCVCVWHQKETFLYSSIFFIWFWVFFWLDQTWNQNWKKRIETPFSIIINIIIIIISFIIYSGRVCACVSVLF